VVAEPPGGQNSQTIAKALVGDPLGKNKQVSNRSHKQVLGKNQKYLQNIKTESTNSDRLAKGNKKMVKLDKCLDQ